jgi:AcrR family transcriptional regulator
MSCVDEENASALYFRPDLDMSPAVNAAVKPEGLRERRRREVRKRILRAARELLSERDVDSVRADEIAERAKVSRATFFNYYPSKSDLLTDLGVAIIRELETLAASALESYEDLDGALGWMLGQAFTRIKRDEQISRQLIDHLTRTTSSQDARVELMGRTHAAYRSLLERARENGEIAPDQDLALLSELLASVTNGLLTNWFNDPEYPLQNRLVQTVTFFTGALVTR